jgi:D-glycero-D-manno-heptose 1,7-bisphosphate phosphatase
MKLIILDRDGVINQDSDAFIKSAEEWQPIPNSIEAIASLSQAGFRVVVATNQSGLARGYFTLEVLHKIHQKMLNAVEAAGGHIDAILFCPHGADDQCICRKPKAGMFHEIAQRLGIKLHGIPAIGDSLRDLQAAQAADATPILVRTGKGEKTVTQIIGTELENIAVYDDLAQAVQVILMD